jgi:hypothetical protein
MNNNTFSIIPYNFLPSTAGNTRITITLTKSICILKIANME